MPIGMTLLLDPRTKSSAKTFLQVPDTAEAVTTDILEETKRLMRIEHHRVFYKGLYAKDDQGGSKAASATSSPPTECCSSSDNEADLVCGEDVSEPAGDKSAEATLNSQAMHYWTSG